MIFHDPNEEKKTWNVIHTYYTKHFLLSLSLTSVSLINESELKLSLILDTFPYPGGQH